jgi:hypothetical protein
MSNELVIAFDTGSTLYARVFDSTGQVWNGTAFESWVDGNVGNYDVALADKSSGQYIGDFPSAITDGRYVAVVYKQAGASPHITNDAVVGSGLVVWNGTSEIHECTDEQKVFNIYNEA